MSQKPIKIKEKSTTEEMDQVLPEKVEKIRYQNTEKILISMI